MNEIIVSEVETCLVGLGGEFVDFILGALDFSFTPAQHRAARLITFLNRSSSKNVTIGSKDILNNHPIIANEVQTIIS